MKPSKYLLSQKLFKELGYHFISKNPKMMTEEEIMKLFPDEDYRDDFKGVLLNEYHVESGLSGIEVNKYEMPYQNEIYIRPGNDKNDGITLAVGIDTDDEFNDEEKVHIAYNFSGQNDCVAGYITCEPEVIEAIYFRLIEAGLLNDREE